MCGATGRAVVAGATTTAATFYAFTFTDFTGLRQMGLLTGTGILLCMTSVLCPPRDAGLERGPSPAAQDGAEAVPAQLRHRRADRAAACATRWSPWLAGVAADRDRIGAGLAHPVRREHEDHAAHGQPGDRGRRRGGAALRLRVRLDDRHPLREIPWRRCWRSRTAPPPAPSGWSARGSSTASAARPR